jgi:hypothetical protein
LGEGGLEVFDDLPRNDVGVGKIGAVSKAFVFEPEDIEVKLESLASAAAALRVAVTIIHGAENNRD